MSSSIPLMVVAQAQIHSARLNLPLALVLAIIQVESGGDIHAWNPEPQYRYLFDVLRRQPFRNLTAAERTSEVPPSDFRSLAGDRDAEWWGQQASWGCMQVMGAVARELGFSQHFPALCEPEAGVAFGCRHLAALRKRFESHGWRGAAAAYNAGSPRYVSGTTFENQAYVDKIERAGGFVGVVS